MFSTTALIIKRRTGKTNAVHYSTRFIKISLEGLAKKAFLLWPKKQDGEFSWSFYNWPINTHSISKSFTGVSSYWSPFFLHEKQSLGRWIKSMSIRSNLTFIKVDSLFKFLFISPSSIIQNDCPNQDIGAVCTPEHFWLCIHVWLLWLQLPHKGYKKWKGKKIHDICKKCDQGQKTGYWDCQLPLNYSSQSHPLPCYRGRRMDEWKPIQVIQPRIKSERIN